MSIVFQSGVVIGRAGTFQVTTPDGGARVEITHVDSDSGYSSIVSAVSTNPINDSSITLNLTITSDNNQYIGFWVGAGTTKETTLSGSNYFVPMQNVLYTAFGVSFSNQTVIVDLSGVQGKYLYLSTVCGKNTANLSSGNYNWNDGVNGSIIVSATVAQSNTYTVQFHSENGKSQTETQTIEAGVATALDPNPFTYTEHAFVGWATSSGGAKVYDDEEVVTDIAAAGATVDLYAVWEKIAGYLLGDDNHKIYTVSNGAAVEIVGATESSLTKAFFQANGFLDNLDEVLLLTLTDPIVYCWDLNEAVPLSAEASVVPYPQAIKTVVDLSPTYIIGIANMEVTYSGNVGVQYSYDDSTYTQEIMAAAFLDLDKSTIYAGLGVSKQLYIKFILDDENATLTRFRMTFRRRAFSA